MITVHSSNGVSRAIRKDCIEIPDLGLPLLVWSELSLREHEGLSGVEELVDGRQICMIAGNIKDAR